MNPLKRLAGQTVIYGLSSILGRLLNYFLVPLYTRVFVTAEYGIVTEMYAYAALFFVILTYGMETAFFRFSQEEDLKKIYSTSLVSLFVSSLGFVLLAVSFSSPLAGLLDYQNHREYIVWFAVILGLDAFTAIPFARLRQENKALRFALVKIAGIGSNVLLNLFFILLCPYLHTVLPAGSQGARLLDLVYDPSIGVGYVFIANLCSSGLTLLLLLPQLRDFRPAFHRETLKRMLTYGLPLLIMGLAGTINESFDRILLKHLLPDPSTAMSQLGIYGACYKLAILMTLFIQTFRFAAEPFFFSEAKNQEAKQTYARVMNYFVIICALIFLGIMAFIDVVKHFIGKDYYPGLRVVPILLFANLFLGIFYNLSIWYKLTNRTLIGAYVSLFGAFLSLSLNYLLIPVMGYVGSAWTHLACYASMTLISWYLGQRYYPVDYPLKKIGFYLAFSLLLFFLNQTTRVESVTANLFQGVLYLLAFLVPVYLIERRDFGMLRAGKK